MIFYADSSFLVSLYLVVDANYGAAKRSMQRFDPTLPWTEFGTFELKNAVRSVAFRTTITMSDAEGVLRWIERDAAAEFLAPTTCAWEDILHTAESLSQRHTYLIGCRALDVLHVASVVVLGCREFLTFDQRQAQLARQAGLSTPT